MTEKEFNSRLTMMFAARRKELLEKLKHLDQRKKEGWGYKKIWREKYLVPAYKVRGHFAVIPVKRS